MSGIKRLVLDVLKPHRPTSIDLSVAVSSLNHVTGVNLSLYEVDQETENVKITIEGDDIVFDEVKNVIEQFGAAIHSVDEVATGRKLVEEVETLQDRT
ncbi:MAG: putative ArCR_ [Candidatus Argoarchaeum ethanivorans]|uniref:Putative ArCR n=1 Tax=Candidatus Argoarchaeum ethanivorans TaxID=2608793 RepID=A0A811TA69_9EURY|nr:MAG: putative ArCR_ [Candidatus Argoarchaeum ethanivorans]